MIGFVDPYTFTSIPAGLIVPYNAAGAAPAGWSLLTTPNIGVAGYSGCYIAGAGTAYSVGQSGIGGTPSGQVTFNSAGDYNAENGLHQGTQYFTTKTGGNYLGPTPAAANRIAVDGQFTGTHNHKIDVTPTIVYTQTQFIKAGSQMEKFPANSILLNTTHSAIPWLTATYTNNTLLRAGNSIAQSSPAPPVVLVNDSIKHTHSWDYWDEPTFDPAVLWAPWNFIWRYPGSYKNDGLEGGHTHPTSSVYMAEYIKKVYTTAWTYASDFIGFHGMIAFWDALGGAAIPSGWQLCNGTNGTIDMRDHFIMMSTTTNLSLGRQGNNMIDITATTVPQGSVNPNLGGIFGGPSNFLANSDFGNNSTPPTSYHNHLDAAREGRSGDGVGCFDRIVYHGREAINHYHPGTEGLGLSFYPQFCALYIIQKM